MRQALLDAAVRQVVDVVLNGSDGQVVQHARDTAHQLPRSGLGERLLERPGRRRPVAQELGATDARHGIDQRLTVAGSARDRDPALPPVDAGVEPAIVVFEQRHRRVDRADNLSVAQRLGQLHRASTGSARIVHRTAAGVVRHQPALRLRLAGNVTGLAVAVDGAIPRGDRVDLIVGAVLRIRQPRQQFGRSCGGRAPANRSALAYCAAASRGRRAGRPRAPQQARARARRPRRPRPRHDGRGEPGRRPPALRRAPPAAPDAGRGDRRAERRLDRPLARSRGGSRSRCRARPASRLRGSRRRPPPPRRTRGRAPTARPREERSTRPPTHAARQGSTSMRGRERRR